MQVALSYVVLLGIDPFVVSREEDTFALALVLWLNYKSFCFPFVKLLSKLFHISWQNPGPWKKLVVVWKVFLHRQQVFGKEVLTGHRIHAWKVVGPLIRLHFHEKTRNYWPVNEPNVPIVVILNTGAKLALISDLMDDFILCVKDVQDQPILILLFIGVSQRSGKR